MPFKPHGDYELFLTGDIVRMKFMNRWNVECAEEFFSRYKDLVEKNGLERFGVLSDLSRLEGGSPDVIERFAQISDWARENGQIARALILDTRLKAYIIEKIDNGRERFPVQAFSREKEALAWLKSFGLSASDAE